MNFSFQWITLWPLEPYGYIHIWCPIFCGPPTPLFTFQGPIFWRRQKKILADFLVNKDWWGFFWINLDPPTPKIGLIYVRFIKAMLSGPGQFAENETNEVNFREIPSHVLTKLCQYFAYKFYYTGTSREVPEFHIPSEIAIELLMAANFLDC